MSDTGGFRSAQSPDTDMAFDCGVLFSKLKRGFAVTPSAGSSSSSSSDKCKHTSVKDNRTALLGESADWSEFEGVRASGDYSVYAYVSVCVSLWASPVCLCLIMGVSICLPFTLGQDGIYALGKAHMRSTPFLRSFLVQFYF